MTDISMLIHSVHELIISEARVDGFRFARETSYHSGASVDVSTFKEARLEWKRVTQEGLTSFVFRFPQGLLVVGLRNNFLHADAYGVDDDAAIGLLELVRQRIPPSEQKEDVVEVSFWRRGQHGPQCTKRGITGPAWPEVRGNYVNTTCTALEELLATDFESGPEGKLVLWHGEPGTGKTYALRSWARTCQDTIDINYIVDPDLFFGASADYMLDILTRAPRKKLNLFVAEDTGELLATDARQQTGQALSRLLNVCDGLIGQGLRILVLITTNEDLGALHPAIVRPGRCYANITFETFDQAQAREWLRSHGVESMSIPSRSTIAELYAAIENKQIIAQKPKQFGFAGQLRTVSE
ncbi:MAG: AAA family ATPase [Thermoleophilia bacterium]|nr:AAA family ATPase [Thermoleophilia bacterium]